jgi:hypothetical protein|tara:strand:- start:193 stop:462 length:270 start_codon:yes stop_codon:yes gene_type:complete
MENFREDNSIKYCTALVRGGRFLGDYQTYRGGIKSGTHSNEHNIPTEQADSFKGSKITIQFSPDLLHSRVSHARQLPFANHTGKAGFMR